MYSRKVALNSGCFTFAYNEYSDIFSVLIVFLLSIFKEGFAYQCGATKLAVNNVTLHGCPGVRFQSIYSKPHKNSTVNSTCVWLITAPPNNLITISIYLLIFSGKGCGGDENLKIFDGVSSSDKLVKKYCTNVSTNSSEEIWLSGESGRLELQQGASTTTPVLLAFTKAKVECRTTKVIVKNISLTTTAESIISKPHENSTCLTSVWLITAPPGHFATVTISNLRFTGKPCNAESLQIFDGLSSSDKRVNNFHTNKSGEVIWLTGMSGRLELKQGIGTFSTGPVLEMDVKALEKPKACNNGSILSLKASSEITNFTSPYYPMFYPMFCRWLIEAPQGKYVKLTFTKIEIHRCNQETLHVYDGDTQTPEDLIKQCRYYSNSERRMLLLENEPIFSYGRKLLVDFKANINEYSIFKGFTGFYTAVEGGKHCSPGNANNVNFPPASGNITSPGFPVSLPSDDKSLKCLWRLRAPKGQVIKVDLDSVALSVSHSINHCSLDFYTNIGPEVYKIGNYKCSDKNYVLQSLVSDGRRMEIQYSQALLYSSVKGGFHLRYSMVSMSKNGSCKANSEGTIDVQGDAGAIHSPNYPRYHPTNMTCRWKILVSPGNVIELTANINQLNGNCSIQWIRVYDGHDTSSSELVKLCNITTSLHTFFSSSNRIVVEFVTKGNTKYKGFYITYAARKAKPKSYACSKSRDINASSGQIASQRFPLCYSNNVFCRETIVLPKLNYRVNLTFTSLDIEPDGDKCEKDYVEIKSLSKTLARLCGKKTTPFSIISKNNEMEITFRTDAVGRYPGYEATFTSLQDCKDNISMTTPSGTIFTPRYPDGYPPNITCTWTLEPPKANFIRLSIDKLQMKNCSYTSLEIRDIQANQLIARLCGRSERPHVYFSSSGSGLMIQFVSSDSATTGGFTAHYETISQLPQSISCGETSLNRKLKGSSSGSIASYEYPLKYQNNVECTWVISTSGSHIFNIKFDFMDIEPSPGCKDDYVQVRDGEYSISKSLGKFCGSTKPDSFKSSESSIFVEFITNGTGQYGGFKLSYEDTMSGVYIAAIVGSTVLVVLILTTIIFKYKKNTIFASTNAVPAPPEGAASTAGSTIELTAKT